MDIEEKPGDRSHSERTDDFLLSLLLGIAAIGVSWLLALFTVSEIESANSLRFPFAGYWALFFLGFASMVFFSLRRYLISMAGFFTALALFVLLQGCCWALLR